MRGGKVAFKTHPKRQAMEGAPLDSTTWPLCVQSPKARLPQLRHQTILQNLHQKVTQFSGKFLGIDYALLPNRE